MLGILSWTAIAERLQPLLYSPSERRRRRLRRNRNDKPEDVGDPAAPADGDRTPMLDETPVRLNFAGSIQSSPPEDPSPTPCGRRGRNVPPEAEGNVEPAQGSPSPVGRGFLSKTSFPANTQSTTPPYSPPDPLPTISSSRERRASPEAEDETEPAQRSPLPVGRRLFPNMSLAAIKENLSPTRKQHHGKRARAEFEHSSEPEQRTPSPRAGRMFSRANFASVRDSLSPRRFGRHKKRAKTQGNNVEEPAPRIPSPEFSDTFPNADPAVIDENPLPTQSSPTSSDREDRTRTLPDDIARLAPRPKGNRPRPPFTGVSSGMIPQWPGFDLQQIQSDHHTSPLWSPRSELPAETKRGDALLPMHESPQLSFLDALRELRPRRQATTAEGVMPTSEAAPAVTPSESPLVSKGTEDPRSLEPKSDISMPDATPLPTQPRQAAANIAEYKPSDVSMADVGEHHLPLSRPESAIPESNESVLEPGLARIYGHGSEPWLPDSPSSEQAYANPVEFDLDPIELAAGSQSRSHATASVSRGPLSEYDEQVDRGRTLARGSRRRGNLAPSQVNTIDEWTSSLPLSAQAQADSSAIEDEVNCYLCGQEIGLPRPQGLPTERRAYLPCGHNLGHRCMFNYLNTDGLDRGRCPHPNCTTIIHNCRHYAVPSKTAPRQRFRNKQVDVVPWEYVFCGTPAAVLTIALIERTGRQLRQMEAAARGRKWWLDNLVATYRMYILNLAEKRLVRQHDIWWFEQERDFLKDN